MSKEQEKVNLLNRLEKVNSEIKPKLKVVEALAKLKMERKFIMDELRILESRQIPLEFDDLKGN